MSATDIPAGWHPDPANPAGSLRWWDGTQWTDHTQPPVPISAPTAPVAPAGQYWGGNTPTYGGPVPTSYGGRGPSFGGSPAAGSMWQRNQGSLTAIGVAAVYVLIAVTTHFVLFGIVPAMAAFRAVKRKEPLAALAVVAAAIAIIVAISALAGH